MPNLSLLLSQSISPLKWLLPTISFKILSPLQCLLPIISFDFFQNFLSFKMLTSNHFFQFARIRSTDRYGCFDKILSHKCVLLAGLVIIGISVITFCPGFAQNCKDFFLRFKLLYPVEDQPQPHQILLDTDVDTDDFFALLYILKLNRSKFHLQAVTINSNSWTNAGHAVNHIYDLLYMMGRDDIAVGVGGEGGILEDGDIQPNVGGYLPLIEQRTGTAGYCRYRQAIPVARGGTLDIDTNFGFRKGFLPQGRRKYLPLQQPTAQQVMIDKISAGPTTVFLIGAHTNFGIFLMKNPHLKRHVKHIYIMGGSVRSKDPTGVRGNLLTVSNPYAEYNMFVDPFAAYQVIHSGIPVTLVPLDATNTIPTTPEFFEAFEKNQHTYEAQYCFKSLKISRDTWLDNNFYTSHFMWDSFLAGVATSIMRKPHNKQGENEFAEMEFMNITVVTSNEPYGVSDGSNPFYNGRKNPKFNLTRNGVHSGHVQSGLHDPFCFVKNGKGRCQDGCTKEVTGQEAVEVLVAVKAKPNRDSRSSLNREFFKSFLDALNHPQHSGRFNITTQFLHYKENVHKPDFAGKTLGKNVVFDMDMSAGDFLALFYLLKIPVEIINIKAILITPTGWANGGTIDVVYDLLHMMGRDDIPIGLGKVYATNQSDPSFSAVGDCKYKKAIPHGSGGFLDSDTLFGLARELPRSPRRYTGENSVKFGAPRNTDHPELRQPLALEVWESVVKSLDPGSKVTILTNGPLTTAAEIVASGKNMTSSIQEIIIVGGHINDESSQKGNVINVPSNKYAEMNMFLDPLAAKIVLDSGLSITLIPLGIQRKVSTFLRVNEILSLTEKTPEVLFAWNLLSSLQGLKQAHPRYKHVDTFLGEILGAVFLGGDHSVLKPSFELKNLKIWAQGVEAEDGQITVDRKQGKLVKVLENVNPIAYYKLFATQLGVKQQSAVVGSFEEQRRSKV